MTDLVCYSHVRWDLGGGRAQPLMARAARDRRVWFVEEPLHEPGPPRLRREVRPEGVVVCTPILPPGLSPAATERAVAGLLESLAMVEGIHRHVAWVYAPRMLPLVEVAEPAVVVYDCVEERSAAASPQVLLRERALLARADLVFTAGPGPNASRRGLHPRVHDFPSAVDAGAPLRERAWDATWAAMDRLVAEVAAEAPLVAERVAP